MKLYFNDNFKIKYKDKFVKCKDYEFILSDISNQADIIAFVTGDKSDAVALTAVLLINNNIKTVLLPKIVNLSGIINYTNSYVYDGFDIYIVKDKAPQNDWILGMFTSGSTGNPKLFGFSAKQVNKTLDWYHEIYMINKNSLIITAMPVTYNFSFIAGVCNMASVGGTFASAGVEQVPDIIEQEGRNYERIVILANPVLLDDFSDKLLKYNELNLLIDSGGSPLTKKAIEVYRSRGIDLREGYGLTETCSLTHFDVEGNAESIGTVGKGIDGVRVEFVSKDSRNYLKIYSPNLGRQLNFQGEWESDGELGYLTTDIVKEDGNGRLVLLGRATDMCINGYWPKDTLNIIGECIGVNCVLVQHVENENIFVTFLKDDIDVNMELIKNVVSKKLNVSNEKIRIFINDEEMLHSIKIRRKDITNIK